MINILLSEFFLFQKGKAKYADNNLMIINF
jgi:hypothetical protein